MITVEGLNGLINVGTRTVKSPSDSKSYILELQYYAEGHGQGYKFSAANGRFGNEAGSNTEIFNSA